MQRYVPLARARARRLNLIEFLPPTTAPFTATATMQAASLILLVTARIVGADVIDPARAYASHGACYDTTAHVITCQLSGGTSSDASGWNQALCEGNNNVWYPAGHVGNDGCCYCDNNCDHSLETSTDCNYRDASAGSCYNPDKDQVTCDMKASECTGNNVYSAPGAIDPATGCCFCDESCDHSLETGTNCGATIYADESSSDGSCYESNGAEINVPGPSNRT